MISKKPPILVTGIHRSGSTWVGKMIALSGKVGYIHEPFNRNSGISGNLMKHWFTYVCEENEDVYHKAISDYISFKYPLRRKIEEAESVRDVARAVRDFTAFSWKSLLNRRPLVKDPISIFSAEWLSRRFDMDVVVIIRHPAAFVGSIKKAGWRTGMSNFLDQPLLMRDHLQDFREEIVRQSQAEVDIIDEAILLWNMIHSTIHRYQKRGHPRWFFVRHEDLSRYPAEGFSGIYRQLDLEYTDRIIKKVRHYSADETAGPDGESAPGRKPAGGRGSSYEPGGKSGGARDSSPGIDPGLAAGSRHNIRRDSKSNIRSWKQRLTTDEIEKIRRGTRKIAGEFFTDEDW